MIDLTVVQRLRICCPDEPDRNGNQHWPVKDVVDLCQEAANDLEAWYEAGQQFLDSADAIIVQVGSDVLPKGWLASANRLRALLPTGERRDG